MSGLMAWVGDRLVPAERATVSVYDRAFRSGEGVFETMRVYGNAVFRLDRHLDRALHGAGVLGFEPPTREQLAEAIRATVAANAAAADAQGAAIRLTLSPGSIDPDSDFPGEPLGPPMIAVTFHRLRDMTALWEQGVRAVTVPWGREVPSVKAVSYLASSLARRRARAQGADEALFTDATGHVLEASTANVFAVIGGLLVTPPVEAGLLPGVTRQAVLEIAGTAGLSASERPLPLEELIDADEAILTASTRGVVPLVAVDDRAIGAGGRGPATARLQATYRSLAESETVAS